MPGEAGCGALTGGAEPVGDVECAVDVAVCESAGEWAFGIAGSGVSLTAYAVKAPRHCGELGRDGRDGPGREQI